MKKKLHVYLPFTLAAILFFAGCQKDDLNETEKFEQEEISNTIEFPGFKNDLVYCGESITAALTDYEQNYTAGTVTIGNDSDSLYIIFEAAIDWDLTSALLYIGPPENSPGDVIEDDDPLGGEGVFLPWLFPHKTWPKFPAVDFDSKTYSFPLDILDNDFIVIAYCNATNQDTAILAWGKAYEYISTQNVTYGGYYFNYSLQECEPAPALGSPKLAFAYNESSSQCFKEIKRKNGKYNPDGYGTWSNFWLWGWRQGKYGEGTYSFDLWAGSKDCEAENGILVGEVTLEIVGTTATVSYSADPAYNLISTYVYVGKKRLPKKWGKYRVLPWYYPYKHHQLNEDSDTYTINNLTNDVYFIAGAIVNDAE